VSARLALSISIYSPDTGSVNAASWMNRLGHREYYNVFDTSSVQLSHTVAFFLRWSNLIYCQTDQILHEAPGTLRTALHPLSLTINAKSLFGIKFIRHVMLAHLVSSSYSTTGLTVSTSNAIPGPCSLPQPEPAPRLDSMDNSERSDDGIRDCKFVWKHSRSSRR
jgi:hypothetical protein